MPRLNQREIIRSQSCRVSVKKLKVFDDQNELVHQNERVRPQDSVDVEDPEKSDSQVPVQPEQVKLVDKHNVLFKESSVGQFTLSKKQTGRPKSRKLEVLMPEIRLKPLEETVQCSTEPTSLRKDSSNSVLEAKEESTRRDSLQKKTKKMTCEVDDNETVPEIHGEQNGDSKLNDVKDSVSSLMEESGQNLPTSPTNFKDSLSEWGIESKKKKTSKSSGSSSVRSISSKPDSSDFTAMIDTLLKFQNGSDSKLYRARVRLKRINVEKEKEKLRKRIKLDVEEVEHQRPSVSPTKVSTLLSPTKITPDFYNSLYKNANWMKDAKGNKVQMIFTKPQTKLMVQEKSGLKVRIPLRARSVKEAVTPRGFEFYVNHKKPVLKLNQVDVKKENAKLRKIAYNQRLRAKNNLVTVQGPTSKTLHEPVGTSIQPFDYFKRGHFLAPLFGLFFEEDAPPPPPPPTAAAMIRLPTIPHPPQKGDEEYEVIIGTGGHIIGYKLKKNKDKQVTSSSSCQVISLANNYQLPEQQQSNLLQARLLAPKQAPMNALGVTGGQVFRLPNGQIFTLQMKQNVNQQNDIGVVSDGGPQIVGSDSDSDGEDLSSFLTPQMSMDVEESKAINAATLCSHVPDPGPESILEPEVIDIDEDDDGDPLEVRPPVLPPPVNNNKPGQFTVVSGPRGPVLMPSLKPAPGILSNQQSRFVRASLFVPPVQQLPQQRIMPRIISMAQRSPTLVALPPQASAVLSNTPVTRQVLRPSHSVLSNRPPPPLTAQRPAITNSQNTPVILKTYTMSDGVQVASCPFCGLLFKREKINEHILHQHNLKPKSVGVVNRGLAPAPALISRPQVNVPESQKSLNTNGPSGYPVLQQQVAPKPPTLVVPKLSNTSSLQRTQNLSSDDDDDIVELDPLDLGEGIGNLANNHSQSLSGVLSNKVITDVSCSDPLAIDEDNCDETTSSIPSTSKSNHLEKVEPKKTDPMFPCPFCPDKSMFSSSKLHEHIQTSHHQKQQVISVDPLGEFL